MPPTPASRNRLTLLLLWLAFYATFTLFLPPLLDDADSVHAEVAREMLLRHDWVTLYANGIRYLEKAPVLYWSMAASFRLFGSSTAAARLPLALTVLALALLLEAFACQAFQSTRAGLYAGLILLTSFGIFIFTRITIPDADVCLWLSLALHAFWITEQPPAQAQPGSAANVPITPSEEPHRRHKNSVSLGQKLHSPAKNGVILSAVEGPAVASPTAPVPLLACLVFAAACALNVLTKGLIGLVFPVAITALYLLLTRGPRGAWTRLGQLHPSAGILTFLALAAPWHLLIGLANPTQGHPAPITLLDGHWQVPLPTDGNVHGWAWFYFVNEHLLRYLNLRVPRDYDTVPLALFWGLLLVWLMPWSAFLYPALKRIPLRAALRGISWRTHQTRRSMSGSARHPRALTHEQKTLLLLGLWALTPMLFFSLSTRQEYYVLPALPALILLLATFLADAAANPFDFGTELPVPSSNVFFSISNQQGEVKQQGPAFHAPQGGARIYAARRAATSIASALLLIGTLLSATILVFLLRAKAPASNTDLATLLHQNPADYALSFGHFLDLNAQALGLFRLPLVLTALAFFAGPFAHWYLRRSNRPHAATLALAAATSLFLLAAHLGLQTFSPILSSKVLADAIAPQLHPEDLIVLHGEYEAGSTLGFYLRRADLHLCEGRSSNLWYGSFFPDAPRIFETRESLTRKWPGPQRIFLWQDPSDPGRPPLQLPGPTFRIARSGGKEILSNQPNHP